MKTPAARSAVVLSLAAELGALIRADNKKFATTGKHLSSGEEQKVKSRINKKSSRK